MNTHKIFDHLKAIGPVTLLVRHAERFEITRDMNPLEALLTEQGKADAVEYGKAAAVLSPLTVYHSPVKRCRQTAEGIVRGIEAAGGEADPRGAFAKLGDPYVMDNYASTWELFDRFGHHGFFREWFSGRLPRDYLLPLEEAAEIGVNCLREMNAKHNNTVIAVTHDWNIMIIREHFLRQRHEEIGMPGFLEGLAYYRQNGSEKMFSHTVDMDSHVEIG
jgi:broad specificity phosphatase PhoE